MNISFVARKADELERTIRDLDGLARELDRRIKVEEARAKVSDPARPGYPIFALSARERRDRLRASVARFEAELGDARRELKNAREDCPARDRPSRHHRAQ
jgi:hypothetical protein